MSSDGIREIQRLLDDIARSLGPSWPPNFSSGEQVYGWGKRLQQAVADVEREIAALREERIAFRAQLKAGEEMYLALERTSAQEVAALRAEVDFQRQRAIHAENLVEQHIGHTEAAEAERDTLQRALLAWQPIETAPRDGHGVLVAFIDTTNCQPPRRSWVAEAEWRRRVPGEGWWRWPNDEDGGRIDPPPTHWMPWPDPPAPVPEQA